MITRLFDEGKSKSSKMKKKKDTLKRLVANAISAICKKYGLDFNTVKKMGTTGSPAEIAAKYDKPKMTDGIGKLQQLKLKLSRLSY